MRRSKLVVLFALLCGLLATGCDYTPEQIALTNKMLGIELSPEVARSTGEQVKAQTGDTQAPAKIVLAAYLDKVAKEQPWLTDLQKSNPYRVCITVKESGGNYLAKNKRSTASGRYQFLDGTWKNWLKDAEAHYGRELANTKRAMDAPPFVQDVVAARAIVASNGSDWKHPSCNKFKPGTATKKKSKAKKPQASTSKSLLV